MRFDHVEDSQTRAMLEQVRDHGWVLLPEYRNPDWCAQAIAEFEQALIDHAEYVRKQTDQRLFGIDRASPTLRNFAEDAYLQHLSDLYHGTATKLGTCMAGRIEADDTPKLGSGGDWHRDSSTRQLKAIIYLSDVTEQHGPFQLIERSNDAHFKQYKQDMKQMGCHLADNRLTEAQLDRLLQSDASRLKSFCAPSGTVILADTSAIHRGKPIASGTRHAAFNYYYPKRQSDAWIAQKFKPIPNVANDH